MGIIMMACPLGEVNMPPPKRCSATANGNWMNLSKAMDAQVPNTHTFPHVPAPPPTLPITVHGTPAPQQILQSSFIDFLLPTANPSSGAVDSVS